MFIIFSVLSTKVTILLIRINGEIIRGKKKNNHNKDSMVTLFILNRFYYVISVNLVFVSEKIIKNSDNFRIK